MYLSNFYAIFKHSTHKTHAVLQLIVYTISLEVRSQVQAFQHWLPPCVYTKNTYAAIVDVHSTEPAGRGGCGYMINTRKQAAFEKFKHDYAGKE